MKQAMSYVAASHLLQLLPIVNCQLHYSPLTSLSLPHFIKTH